MVGYHIGGWIYGGLFQNRGSVHIVRVDVQQVVGTGQLHAALPAVVVDVIAGVLFVHGGVHTVAHFIGLT